MSEEVGRPSIALEKLLRAELRRSCIRSTASRLLTEQVDYNLLFRWFASLNAECHSLCSGILIAT